MAKLAADSMKPLDYRSPEFWSQLQAFSEPIDQDAALPSQVTGIIEQVRERGNAALRELTQRFDQAVIDEVKVDLFALKAALDKLGMTQKAAIEAVIHNIRAFHQQALPQDWQAENKHGATEGTRFYPLHRVGIYIPRGQARSISTAVMTTTMARLVGVPEVVVCTPPDKTGHVNTLLLATLAICGVREVYRIGGAQAIAALAYGTESIRAVDKIFGLGDAYVAEAKRQVYGQVGIDLLSGPSEMMAVVDGTANAAWVAADLLAQAEYGTRAERLYLIGHERLDLQAIWQHLQEQLVESSRPQTMMTILENRLLGIQVPDLDAAVRVINFVAPNYLALSVAENKFEHFLSNVTTAGMIFLGHNTPTALGDLAVGASYNSATGRTGRFWSGLQVVDFMRHTSVMHYSQDSLKRAKSAVHAFSLMEELAAHDKSLQVRLS